jgi:hypothetical protein
MENREEFQCFDECCVCAVVKVRYKRVLTLLSVELPGSVERH